MDKVFKSYRGESRANYGMTVNPSATANIDQINCGSFMRMADSLESIARDKVSLERQLKYHKERADDLEYQLATEKKRSAALRGVINRMKRRLDDVL